MRTVVFVVLLALPVAAMAYHYGPGQRQLALDDAQRMLTQGAQLSRDGKFGAAISAYDRALESIPTDEAALQQQVRLERAKAQLMNRQLPEAYDELMAIKQDVEAGKTQAGDAFVTDFRKTLADTHYYMTWLLRLEGEPREAWEPDIESARQLYKLLALDAKDAGDSAQVAQSEADIEAAIRLARLDLSELQALPLPKQCQGCCSSNCKGKCQGKKPGPKGQKTGDSRGAGSGPPPDGVGA